MKVKIAFLVQHVGDAPAHACREVPADTPQYHGTAAGHVFAAMVARAFHHGGGPGVADTEAFAGHAADKHLARGGPVERRVAADNVLLRPEAASLGRGDDNAPPGEPLAQVVVAVAVKGKGDALGEECPEALA